MEVKVPGVMAIVVAPVVAHVRVLVAPELTVVGLAVKEEIVGAEPVPEDELGIVEPQPSRTRHASVRISRFTPSERNLFDLSFSL